MYIILLGSYMGQAMGHTQEKICSISEVEGGRDCGHMGSAGCPTIATNHPCTTNHKYTELTTNNFTNTQS